MGLGRRRNRWVWEGGGIGYLGEEVVCLFEVPLASSVMFYFFKDECIHILFEKLKDNK